MVRILGACCIVVGCGGFGFAMAAASRREEQELKRLLAALEYMSCELSYRQTEPDVRFCIYGILERLGPPKLLRRELNALGATLGRFDLPGQLRGLENAIRSAGETLRTIRDGAADRRRSWQPLGLCAGAALAILFL